VGTAATVLVCCVGLPLGIFGVGYLSVELDKRDSISTLENYLDAMRDEDYDAAYDMLCDDAKAGVDRAKFVADSDSAPRLVSYKIGEPTTYLEGDIDDVGYEVYVVTTFDDGTTNDGAYLVYTEGLDADAYHVCPPAD